MPTKLLMLWNQPLLDYPPSLHQLLALLILPSSLPIEVTASTSASATTEATFTSLILEPSWLSQVYEDQSRCSDKKMAKLVTLARGIYAIYSIWSVYGLDLVYRHL